MGSSSSKTIGLLTVEQCKEMNLAPSSFIKYAQQTGDSILGYAGCLNSLAVKMDKQAIRYMTKTEKSTFAQLEVDKMKLIDAIKVFMLKEKMRFQLMGKEAKIDSNMKDLIRNVRPEDHYQEISQMQDNIRGLQTRYEHFKSELEESCRIDGRSKQTSYKFIVGCLSTCAMVTFALVAILVIVLAQPELPLLATIGLGVGGCLVDDFAALAALAACSAGMVSSGTVLACSLRKDEIDRAIQYMKSLQTNLQTLKESMQALDAEDTVIKETKQLEHTVYIAAALEERCGHIAQICDEVSRSTFCG